MNIHQILFQLADSIRLSLTPLDHSAESVSQIRDLPQNMIRPVAYDLIWQRTTLSLLLVSHLVFPVHSQYSKSLNTFHLSLIQSLIVCSLCGFFSAARCQLES